MSEGPKLLRISDFEWGSVGNYIHYISEIADLRELSTNRIYSFHVGRIGTSKLLTQKIKTEEVILENKRKLENLAISRKAELDRNELSVIRGIYKQLAAVQCIVTDHVDRLTKMKDAVQVEIGLEQSEEEITDDNQPPF